MQAVWYVWFFLLLLSKDGRSKAVAAVSYPFLREEGEGWGWWGGGSIFQFLIRSSILSTLV